MKEVKENKFKSSSLKKINIKMSNMDMRILINKKNKKFNLKNSLLLDREDIKKQILPSFTKKIFQSVSRS